MKRTPLQRHNRALLLCHKAYRRWQVSEAGTPASRRNHRHYTRLLTYLHALEDAQEVNQ